MKKLKNDKKFSFLEEYKKQMENPLLAAYKTHLNLLHECYIDELKKNKELKLCILEIIKYIIKDTWIVNEEKYKKLANKYKSYFDIAWNELKTKSNKEREKNE